MRKLRELYDEDNQDVKKDPWDKGKYPGPYHPKTDTLLVISGVDELGDEDDPGPTLSEEEDKDMVKISRKEYEDLCRKAGM